MPARPGEADVKPPMTPLEYHVLLVLAGGNLYGYAIKKAVARESGGAVSPEIGSLYRVLARLLEAGLVAGAAAGDGDGDVHPGRDRRYYTLTGEGRRALQAETARLRRVLALADERDLLPEPPRG